MYMYLHIYIYIYIFIKVGAYQRNMIGCPDLASLSRLIYRERQCS